MSNIANSHTFEVKSALSQNLHSITGLLAIVLMLFMQVGLLLSYTKMMKRRKNSFISLV